MARKQVVEIHCDRCTRIEHRTDDGASGSEKDGLTFAAQMLGAPGGQPGVDLVATFEDLCTPCYRTVRNHLEAIAKKIDGPSPDREVKAKTIDDLLVDKDKPLVMGPKPKKSASAVADDMHVAPPAADIHGEHAAHKKN